MRYTCRRENRLGGSAGHDFESDPGFHAYRTVGERALGVARAAFEYARDYAKEREAFGVKIAQKQAVAFMLAEMRTELEAIRLLTWEAAWKLDAGKAGCLHRCLSGIGRRDGYGDDGDRPRRTDPGRSWLYP